LIEQIEEIFDCAALMMFLEGVSVQTLDKIIDTMNIKVFTDSKRKIVDCIIFGCNYRDDSEEDEENIEPNYSSKKPKKY